ncbi:hypothetical protein D3C83_100900 [compost metagenome]
MLVEVTLGYLGLRGDDLLLFERRLDRVERRHVGAHHVLVVFANEVSRTSFERGFECRIFRIAIGVEVDLALSLEHPRHRVGRTHVATAA